MKSIATALAAAQTQMGKAVKAADNPAFKRDGKVMKYADLSSVMDACLPALNAVGIAVIQPTGENEYGRHVETILIHGESGESLSCQVPLIVSKNDMQGYGSAVTYARRYGLMAMAGIAPEDDDGNAAAKAAPKQELPQPITADQFQEMNDLIFDTETDEAKFCAYWQVDDLHDMTLKQGKDAIAMLTKKKSKLAEKGEGQWISGLMNGLPLGWDA
jgi:hypothetical protein